MRAVCVFAHIIHEVGLISFCSFILSFLQVKMLYRLSEMFQRTMQNRIQMKTEMCLKTTKKQWMIYKCIVQSCKQERVVLDKKYLCG